MTEPSKEVQRWADVAMFSATPLVEKGERVKPRVTIINMTSNPLRVMAAAAEMYKGNPVHDPSHIDHRTAMMWLQEMTRTKIQSALEFVDIHLLIEGVSRAFTHQLVRQRVGASYVQESMRFAVKENARHEVCLPPSLQDLSEDDPKVVFWYNTMLTVAEAYDALVYSGIPAEDARGLLPTNIATRIHYKTTLRGLVEHSGLRLCSQAQQEWKLVWGQILMAIRRYGPSEEYWQQHAIANLFRPICYQTGKCEFMGQNDRWCIIRDRVQTHYQNGEKPDTWHDISPLEPLRPDAARVRPGEKR